MGKNHHHHPPKTEGNNAPPNHGPYWKRAHTDWRFWIGVLLMLLAIYVYVATMDLAWRPGRSPQPPVPAAL